MNHLTFNSEMYAASTGCCSCISTKVGKSAQQIKCKHYKKDIYVYMCIHIYTHMYTYICIKYIYGYMCRCSQRDLTQNVNRVNSSPCGILRDLIISL